MRKIVLLLLLVPFLIAAMPSGMTDREYGKFVEDSAGDTAIRVKVTGGSTAPEGTAVLSTGETGGNKYLREDGDGTSSWQVVAGGAHDAVTLDADAAVLFDLATQEIGLDTQTANKIFGGPATGAANEPTFRSLVAADIPDISATYEPAGITESDISDLQAYLTAEVDPTVDSSAKIAAIIGAGVYEPAGITESDISDLQAYLTAEVDGSTTNEIEVVDEAFNATNFNGGTTSAVSQDDFYDVLHVLDTDDDGDIDTIDATLWAGKQDAGSYLTSEVDGSTTNEINTITCPDLNVTAGLGIIFADTGIMTITESADTITFNATEVDGSTTNEINTITLPDANVTAGVGITFAQSGPIAITESAADTVLFTVTEVDPTVNTSAEIVAIIGAGVYDASGAAAAVTPTTLNLLIGTNTQAWDAQLDDLADGTLTGDFVNTAYPWADNEVSDTLTASTSTTAAANDNDTSIATTAFVQQEIKNDTHSGGFVITTPIATSDYPVWRAPYALTITAVHIQCLGNQITGHLVEMDANGLNGAGVDGETDITGVVNENVNDDGTLSNPTIDANDYIGWRTTSITGTPTSATITFEFTRD